MSHAAAERVLYAYENAHPGFYVVNPRTDLAVAGPYAWRDPAQAEADSRNATPPAASDSLVVVEVV